MESNIQASLKFVNQSNPSEMIEVADLESAQTLQKLLSQNPNLGWAREAPVITDDRRKVERVAKELRVILMSGSSTFRCATCDVSVGGMKLKAAVPASFCEKTCVAYLSQTDAQENLEIEVKVMTDVNGVSRLQFVQPKAQELEVLSAWMTA